MLLRRAHNTQRYSDYLYWLDQRGLVGARPRNTKCQKGPSVITDNDHWSTSCLLRDALKRHSYTWRTSTRIYPAMAQPKLMALINHPQSVWCSSSTWKPRSMTYCPFNCTTTDQDHSPCAQCHEQHSLRSEDADLRGGNKEHSLLIDSQDYSYPRSHSW